MVCRLRREAMVKRYSLEELFKHATNKEDIDRQAKAIEQSLQVSRSENVNRVYEKNRVTLNNVGVEVKENEMKRTVNNVRANVCVYCGTTHENKRSSRPATEKKCYNCPKTGHFARMCRAPKKQPAFWKQKNPSSKIMAKYLGDGKAEEDKSQKDNSSDSDFVFRTTTTTTTTAKSSLPTVQVQINGIKGQVEADSCSTANIIDEERFGLLQDALKKKLELKPVNSKLCAYGQEKPIPLVESFEAEVESIGTGKKTIASSVAAKGKTKSRPLPSLDTSVELRVLMIIDTALHSDDEIMNIAEDIPDGAKGKKNLSSIGAVECPTTRRLLSSYNDVLLALESIRR